MGKGLSTRNRLGMQALAASLAVSFATPAFAKNYDYSGTEINQKDAGGYASNNYWNGSGDSKDEGVRNLTRALNHLAALDIGGAIHYGYKGYGNYINSQTMDDLDTASWKKKGTMDSLAGNILSGTSGANGASGITGGGDPPSQLGPESQNAHPHAGSGGASDSSVTAPSHTLANMDRSFLYRGETGEVASEFEKKSGMSREELFNQLAAAEASGLSWDDPNVADKMEARYQAFIAKIPNKEYRDNIEKMHSLFSLAKKTQVLEEAAAFYKKMRWGDGNVAQNHMSDVNAASALSAAAAGEGQGAASANGGRSLASEESAGAAGAGEVAAKAEETTKLTKEQMGMYLGIDAGKGDDLKDLVTNDDSIFRLVSKRYRKLTPRMLGKIM